MIKKSTILLYSFWAAEKIFKPEMVVSHLGSFLKLYEQQDRQAGSKSLAGSHLIAMEAHEKAGYPS